MTIKHFKRTIEHRAVSIPIQVSFERTLKGRPGQFLAVDLETGEPFIQDASPEGRYSPLADHEPKKRRSFKKKPVTTTKRGGGWEAILVPRPSGMRPLTHSTYMAAIHQIVKTKTWFTAKDLADQLDESIRSSASPSLSGLFREGVLERKKNPDQRGYLYRLAKKDESP